MNEIRSWALSMIGFAAVGILLVGPSGSDARLFAQQSPVEADDEHAADDEHSADSHSADEHGADEHGADEHSADSHGADSHADDAQAANKTNPLTIDPDLAICTAIVFLVLLAFLAKFAWKPIMEGLDKRERSIAEQIEEAKRSADEARRSLQQYETKLASAADEVRTLMTQARKDADVSKDRIVAAAKEAAQKERDRAVDDIRLAKEQAVQELAQRSVDTAVNLAGRMIRKEVDSQSHSDLINDALTQFPSKN